MLVRDNLTENQIKIVIFRLFVLANAIANISLPVWLGYAVRPWVIVNFHSEGRHDKRAILGSP